LFAGVDRDEHKVQCVLRGQAPFHEPGLPELVAQTTAAGRLTATCSLPEALQQADIALLCVGTPSEANGNISLEQIRRVCAEMAAVLPARSKPLTVAIRSTVFPGTCEEIVQPALGNHPLAPVVSNPEFLREGCAINDFFEPSLLVVGGAEPAPVRRVADLYAALPVEASLVSLRTAEMIKYACNAFHAVKIGFSNEIGSLGASLGVDSDELMRVVCRDTKLNLSRAYLKPGFAFGGSCLPKDLRALVYRAGRFDLHLPLLSSILPSNSTHLERAIEAVLALPARQLGIFGLTFKEDTDDLRESPVVALLERLLGKGRALRVFDPHVQLSRIYGSNRNFLLTSLPHIGKLLVDNLEELLGWADHLVIAQKAPAALAGRLAGSGLPALDLTRIPPPGAV
jgi:GDP-mannose 6-dehydrogenase